MDSEFLLLKEVARLAKAYLDALAQFHVAAQAMIENEYQRSDGEKTRAASRLMRDIEGKLSKSIAKLPTSIFSD